MPIKTAKTALWAAEIADQPGGLAEALTALAQAGANLELVSARRHDQNRATGAVLVAPLNGRKARATGTAAGFTEANRMIALKLEGDDQPGLAARIADAVAAAGINLRSFTAAVISQRFTCYLGFDSSDDAARASAQLREEFRHHP